MNTAEQLDLFDRQHKEKAETVSEVMRYLIKRSGKTIQTISEETGIPASTLYSISQRNSNRIEILTLQTMARYFGVDLSIFCGLGQYEPSRHLNDREKKLLDKYNALTDAAKERVDDYLTDVFGNPRNRKT